MSIRFFRQGFISEDFFAFERNHAVSVWNLVDTEQWVSENALQPAAMQFNIRFVILYFIFNNVPSA